MDTARLANEKYEYEIDHYWKNEWKKMVKNKQIARPLLVRFWFVFSFLLSFFSFSCSCSFLFDQQY